MWMSTFKVNVYVPSTVEDLGLHELKDRYEDLQLYLFLQVVHGMLELKRSGSIGLIPADGRSAANHQLRI